MASSSSSQRICSACSGSGEIECGPGAVMQCPICGNEKTSGQEKGGTCSACAGSGEIWSGPSHVMSCPFCNSTGKQSVMVIVSDLSGEAQCYTAGTYDALCAAYVQNNLEAVTGMLPSERVSFVLEDGSTFDHDKFESIRGAQAQEELRVHAILLGWFEPLLKK